MAIQHALRSWSALTCLLLAAAPSIAAEILETPVEATKPESAVVEQEGHVPTSGFMRIAVQLPDGTPAAGARLMVNVGTKDESFDSLQKYRCDGQGRVEIALPRTLDLLRIWAAAEQAGYVPLFAQWWPREDKNVHRIPAKFTFNLPQGTTVGGTIVDPAGKPIEDVKVEASLDLPEGTELSRVKPTDSWNNGRSSTKTDSNGRWSFDWIPAGETIEVDLKLSHPEFISDGQSGQHQRDQGIKLADLRDRSARIVMRSGVRLSGVVHDAQGNPVEGAIVIRGDGERFDSTTARSVTDEQGRFEIPPIPAGEHTIGILAKGWMPLLETIQVTPKSEPLDFQLERGRTLRLKFEDPDGNPIPNVNVRLVSWNNSQTIANYALLGNGQWTPIPVKANEKGIYKWPWAPDDPVKLHCSALGLSPLEITVTADGTEQVITLDRPLTVTGSITDAETGKLIPDAMVMQVLHFTPTFLYVNRSDAVVARNGQLEIVFNRTDTQHGIRIEREGYRTQQIGPWSIGDENPVLDIEMQPAKAIQGYVVDSNGAPAKEVSVYLVTATQALEWSERNDRNNNDLFERLTDENGRYSFPAQFEPYHLVAATDKGYAEASGRLDTPPDLLQLEPYARVEGRLFGAGKPVAGEQIVLKPIRADENPALNVEGLLWTTTDSQGRYLFERVPPVPSSVRAFLGPWVESKLRSAQSIPFTPQPGQNLTLDLNAGGRGVTGRITLTGDVPDEMNMNWSLNYLVARREGITPPQSLIDKGFDRGTPWTESLAKTPEGGVFRQTLHHHFVKLSPDGTFVVSGIAPGVYDFLLEIYGPPEGGCLVNPIASRLVKITVPKSEGAFHVGEITIEAAPVIHAGDVVPEIVFQTPDGETRKISDYRGEYLLIDVWATWCAPCVAALPELKTLHAKRGENLQILGLNIDENTVRAKAFLDERNLDWPQGVTDDPSGLMTTLGVSSAPTYLLIDPEGRLVKKVVRLSDLEAELGEL